MIKAVLFDIDGTLVDSRDANAEFFQILLDRCGYRRPAKKEVDKVFHLTMWNAIKFLTKESDKKVTEIWRKGSNFKYDAFHNEKPPKDFRKVAEKLSEKYKLGIVTGRIRSSIEEFFGVSGTKRFFSVIISFESYKKPKPDPEPLLIAAKKLKLWPEECVYVADHEVDFQAANAAGMNFILFCGFSKTGIKGCGFSIKSFKDLPSAIEKLNQKRLKPLAANKTRYHGPCY